MESISFIKFIESLTTYNNKIVVVKPRAIITLPPGLSNNKTPYQTKQWITVFGYRHDPKNDLNIINLVDELVTMLPTNSTLINKTHKRVQFRSNLRLFKFTNLSPPNTPMTSDALIYRSSIFITMSDIINNTLIYTSFQSEIINWLTTQINKTENRLIEITFDFIELN